MSSGKPKVVQVSELFDRLVAEFRSANVPQSVLFQTALRVCAEDSKRAQRGEEPSQVRALVLRARTLLEASHPAVVPPSEGGWPPLGPPGGAAPIRFTGLPAQPPVAPEDAPTPTNDEEQVASAPSVSPTPETAEPVPEPPLPEFEPIEERALETVAGTEAAATAAAPGSERTPPPASKPEPPAPGERPGPAPAGPLGAAAAPVSPVLKLERSSVSFQDLFAEEDAAEPEAEIVSGGASSLMFRIAIVALALLAGAVAFVILWPGVAPRPQGPPRIVESFPAPQGNAAPTAPAAATAAATPAAAPAQAGAMAPAEPTRRPAAPPESARPVRPEEVEGVETMCSPDWAGHAAAFVVHFASYRNRDNAVADAARLGRELGRPAHAVVVDLGAKGTWYRVVVGDFATAGEARAYRAEAIARKTGEVGGVFRLAEP